jgi:SpoVK/Ycf46/Vps4 family AAA+-type ATPase
MYTCAYLQIITYNTVALLYVGESEKNVRDVFERAHQAKPWCGTVHDHDIV